MAGNFCRYSAASSPTWRRVAGRGGESREEKTGVDNGESFVWDCGLDPQQFHTGGGRNLSFRLVRGAEDGEGGSPPRLAVLEDTRAGRLRHYKAMQDTSRKRKAHEYY
ncbi:hypothetical protein TcCL_NonESM13027 [Trypanosoma cruzi]|nr:hypothetical protein TcCL_NonESM13027 [Trypanosoma cruzi]